MSITDQGAGKASVKTLAIRLEPELHAQLSVIAQLRGATISDEIRSALEAHVEATKAAPELAARGQAVLEEIEHDAAIRREAIASLFGGTAPAELLPNPPAREGRTRGAGKQ